MSKFRHALFHVKPNTNSTNFATRQFNVPQHLLVQLGNKLRQIVLVVVLLLVPQLRQRLQNGLDAPTSGTIGRTVAARVGRLVRKQVQQLIRSHRLQLAVVTADNGVDRLHFELLQPKHGIIANLTAPPPTPTP
jgi:hypothetical protein